MIEAMEDIYNDLDNYERVNDAEKIQAENAELKSKIEAITHELEKLKEDYDKLHIEYKKLETNYSSLLKTAKAEIERKTQLITTLNIEKDQLVFRYLSTNRCPPHKKFFNGKPNYHEKDTRNGNENFQCKQSFKNDDQENDKKKKKTKSISEPTCQSIIPAMNMEKKNASTKPDKTEQRQNSMRLDTRSHHYSSLSSEDEDTFETENIKQTPSVDSINIKYSKRNDKMYKDESRCRSPRDSRGSRNKYESREKYSTRRYRQWDDWHYSNRNKETSPKPTRNYGFETREESRNKETSLNQTRHCNFETREESKNGETHNKPTKNNNFETREESRNKEKSPEPTKHYDFETREESRNKETNPKPTRLNNFETKEERNKEKSSRPTRNYKFETREKRRIKEKSPKLSRNYHFETKEKCRNKDKNPQPTKNYNFETREVGTNKEKSPNPTKYDFETREDSRSNETSPKATKQNNFKTEEDGNKEKSPKPTRNSKFETRETGRNKEKSPGSTKPCDFEIREESRNKERNKEKSPKLLRHCNFETRAKPTRHSFETIEESKNKEIRDESHHENGRDGKNIFESPLNGTGQKYNSWYSQNQEHYHLGKDYRTYIEDSEKGGLVNKHTETFCKEHQNERIRKHKLEEECDNLPMSKRRRDDEILTTNTLQNDSETSTNVTLLTLDVARSSDEETVEDVSVKGSTVNQVHEIKLVDPRLTSEKYVQITDMYNEISLSTINGREVELKYLHYDDIESTHCTNLNSLERSYQFEDFNKEICENIHTQVSNVFPVPGEIVKCFDHPLNIPLNNHEYLIKYVEPGSVEVTKNVSNLDAQHLRLSTHTVEDDLELSEDSCENYKTKKSKKSKTKEVKDKRYIKEKKDQGKKCDLKGINASVDENKIVSNTVHVNSNVVEKCDVSKITTYADENKIVSNMIHVQSNVVEKCDVSETTTSVDENQIVSNMVHMHSNVKKCDVSGITTSVDENKIVSNMVQVNSNVEKCDVSKTTTSVDENQIVSNMVHMHSNVVKKCDVSGITTSVDENKIVSNMVQVNSNVEKCDVSEITASVVENKIVSNMVHMNSNVVEKCDVSETTTSVDENKIVSNMVHMHSNVVKKCDVSGITTSVDENNIVSHMVHMNSNVVETCDVSEITTSVNENKIISNMVHVDSNFVENNISENLDINMYDLKDKYTLITLEDLNIKTQNFNTDSLSLQSFSDIQIHSSNEKISEPLNANIVASDENYDTDQHMLINNVDTEKDKNVMNSPTTNTHEKNSNDDAANHENVDLTNDECSLNSSRVCVTEQSIQSKTSDLDSSQASNKGSEAPDVRVFIHRKSSKRRRPISGS